MHLPMTNLPQTSDATPPAIVRVLTRQDVAWNRPIFRAPSLDLLPLPALDPTRLAQELQRIGPVSR
jgi:hypothetical protein